VLLREGLARILAAAGFRIIASAPCADDHVLSTLRQQQSVLFIIDLSDDFDAGLKQIACFKQQYPAGRVVVLADQHQLTRMVSAFRTGANAYLVKVATCEAFVKSLELVMLGVTLLPPAILNLISDRLARNRNDCTAEVTDDGHADNDDGGEDEIVGIDVETNKRAAGADSGHARQLSPRQQAILRCLAEGDSNKTIARKMTMAEATVKVHVKAILRKIQVRNRTQAAIWAMSKDPLILAEDESPLALEELPVEPLPNLNIAHVLSEGHSERIKVIGDDQDQASEPHHNARPPSSRS
jgi:two-component system nitrate/nitrite response regulator NarL